MYPSDARDRWRASLLPDPRVTHWWDERRVAGTRLLKELRPYQSRRAPGSKAFRDDVLWDAYLLFEPDAEWGASMPAPVSWGYTILAAREALARQVNARLRRPALPHPAVTHAAPRQIIGWRRSVTSAGAR